MTQPSPASRSLAIEENGLNVIAETERKGRPSGLFWPWTASNISILGIASGAYLVGFGLNLWQGIFVAVSGVVLSFAAVGIIALAGKRGSAPTMSLSRAVFGSDGNRITAVLSWVLTVGWETLLVTLAVLTCEPILNAMGVDVGRVGKVIALAVVAALVIVAGVLGFDVIMRVQKWISYTTGALTIVFIGLIIAGNQINLSAVLAAPAAPMTPVLAAFVFIFTFFGLGWVNAGADYSRYLPRNASGLGVFGWTTFGGSWAPVLLATVGLLVGGSSPDVAKAVSSNPIGALTNVLPTWFLIPFLVIALLGLVGGAVMDIYSSGLSLLAAGVKVPRPAAALIDGVIMVAGTVYIVFLAQNDVYTLLTGFLSTIGVPMAAWAGVFIADIALRLGDYDERSLQARSGRYGRVNLSALFALALATAVGWGLVDNSYASADLLGWQGYLFSLFKQWGWDGWADFQGTGVGVLFALALGFIAYLPFVARVHRAQSR